MEIGCLYLYKSNIKKAKYQLVIITSGQYEVNGRISNFWNFTHIDSSTGILTKYTGGDYDNDSSKFIKVSENLYKIKYDLTRFWLQYYIGRNGEIKRKTK